MQGRRRLVRCLFGLTVPRAGAGLGVNRHDVDSFFRGHISTSRGHMDPEQEPKGANMLAHADPQPGPGRMPDNRDTQVMQAIGRGDLRSAVALCANVHGSAVGRLCMALVGSQADAQELAQETFIAAHGALVSYRADGTVRAFLFGIARRLCARHLEVRVRRESKLHLVRADAAPSDSLEVVAMQQRAQLARSALQKLRPTEREAVVLRFASDLSFREVAVACGVDEATARKRVSRALAHLRESVREL